MTLTDQLPAGVQYLSASSSQGQVSQAGGVVTAALGSLASEATATVTITVVPEAGGTITNQATVTGSQVDPNPANNTALETTTVIVNQPPTAEAGGPYTVDEGGSLTLVGSGSDPDGWIVEYDWDLDYDGTNFDLDANGATATFSAADLDGPTTKTVALRVTDDAGATHIDVAVVSVENVAPAVTLSGPATAVRGQPITFTGGFSDPGTPDTHEFSCQIVDGSGNVVAQAASLPASAGDPLSAEFQPVEIGAYTVTFTVEDDDAGVGTASFSTTVVVAGLVGDTLLVGAAFTGSQIVIHPVKKDQLRVEVDDVSYGPWPLDAATSIVVYGQDGDDSIQIASALDKPARLYGRGGDDRSGGGSGHDVIDGGWGDDLILGQGGRDIAIGGPGSDRIVGNKGDDILVAGWLDFGGDEEGAVEKIRAVWLSTDPTLGEQEDYFRRIESLDEVGDNDGFFLVLGETVKDSEEDLDVLTGSQGYDWFFHDDGRDLATDLRDEVFAADLTWITATL